MIEKVKEILLKPLDDEDIPPLELPVVEIMMDFEKALMKGTRIAMVGADFLADETADIKEKPKVRIVGCGFHWAQCVFRRIASLKLGPEYR